MPQIKAGKVTPIVTFAKERNQYMNDVPTATEAGYEVQVSQQRAIAAPKGTPAEVQATLKDAFDTAFQDPAYKEFNTSKLLTPHETSGEEVKTEWTTAAATYQELTEKYGIDLGGDQ